MMTRRELLRSLTVVGVTPWLAAPMRAAHGVPPAFFLVTSQPEADRTYLLRALARSGVRLQSNIRPIQPAGQDLSALYKGQLLDPTRTEALPEAAVALARHLRRRSEAGTHLVTIEPRLAAGSGRIRFEVDGIVQEEVAPDHNYHRIEIAGQQGLTVFRLEEGRLSVVTSSCRHQLCRKQGAHAAGRIICAPNRLVATLPRLARPGLDAVTG